jgi:hypothetical protein
MFGIRTVVLGVQLGFATTKQIICKYLPSLADVRPPRRNSLKRR